MKKTMIILSVLFFFIYSITTFMQFIDIKFSTYSMYLFCIIIVILFYLCLPSNAKTIFDNI